MFLKDAQLESISNTDIFEIIRYRYYYIQYEPINQVSQPGSIEKEARTYIIEDQPNPQPIPPQHPIPQPQEREKKKKMERVM